MIAAYQSGNERRQQMTADLKRKFRNFPEADLRRRIVLSGRSY